VFEWLHQRLHAADKLGSRRKLRAVEPLTGSMRVRIESRELINFASNDYLGLAANRGEWTAVGGGSGASPLVSGYRPLQQQLEQKLATWKGTEAAFVFPSGFAANLAVLSSLPEAGDVILSDALNHASIIDGCRLSHAERVVYPHRDTAFVEAWLRTHRRRCKHCFIVTDSIFSMDGTRAPLIELAKLADEFEAILIVDEAHATGVFGATGAGLCEALNLTSDVPIRVGTLSKALGSVGGFVAGPQVVIDYLIQRGRSLIYSTALPQPSLQLSLAALEQMPLLQEARLRLQAIADWVRHELQRSGFDTGYSDSQIVPVILHDNQAVIRASDDLRASGYWVPAIRPPTVPTDTARLRISLSAAHEDSEVEGLLRACHQLARARR